ncbi:glycolate oxidase subunit GlcE [Rhodobacterales bacterium]|nr:glycolate oxidase subunit GlcE [Rhodobacterales bacterium]
MDATLKPRDTRDVAEAVAWAAAEEQPLEIVGHGSKRGLGRPVQAAHVLDLSDLSGVVTYEPAELVLTVKAGTPLEAVEKLVAENNQELSFEPPNLTQLIGGRGASDENGAARTAGTVGGILAANLSGPRRLKAGAARDHILGMEAVSGRGEVFNSGGKVVKNVTGYDLPRALCGSYGTLAVATTVTLKVNPRPEACQSLVFSGLSDHDAVRLLCQAMGSSAEVSGAAHLPEGREGEGPGTLLRVEGFSTSVDYRIGQLESLLGEFGTPERLDDTDSQNLWQQVRDAKPVARDETPVWRISVAPTAGPEVLAALRNQFDLSAFYDWSGGLVWLSCLDGEIHDEEIRAAVAASEGGHATLMRADASVRSAVDVFQPQPAPLVALSRRLKQQFDPKAVLNPGRMVRGE